MNCKWPLVALMVTLLSVCLCGCRDNGEAPSFSTSMYYWRTTFKLDNNERAFIHNHNVGRLYMRMFDVADTHSPHGNGVIPQATIVFNDSIPKGVSIVPVVYITNSAMNMMEGLEADFASKIVRRVNAIAMKHGFYVGELQLDCDWTKSTRKTFYQLCREVKMRLNPDQRLSCTIRLHQLRQTPPPVDRGMLMVYNTGDFQDPNAHNSIFDPKDIKPYLATNALANYKLPIDVAYPVYGWSLVYANDDVAEDYKFRQILSTVNLADIRGLERIDDNTYVNTGYKSIFVSGGWIHPGMRVRVERPGFKDLMGVKRLIDAQLKHRKHQNVIYHLDSKQLSKYSPNEINKIFRRD